MNRAGAIGVTLSRQRLDCVRFSAALVLPVAPRGQSGDESPLSTRWRDGGTPVVKAWLMGSPDAHSSAHCAHEPGRDAFHRVP